MSIAKSAIDQAITGFEAHNGFRIAQYVPHSSSRTSSAPYKDELIAADVFYDRIVKWLNTCDSDILENELLKLLEQFNYYPYERFVDCVCELIESILVGEHVAVSDILFVMPASSKHCKSGGDDVRSAIKQTFRNDIDNEQLIYYSKEAISINGCSCVVFIDDIIGSGCTMFRLVREFYKNNPWLVDKQICLAGLCGRRKAIDKKVKDLNKKLGLIVTPYVLHVYEKCFEENYNEVIGEYEKRINHPMNRLINDEEEECEMGFHNSQLLVSFYYNTPNNTLSCFWRRTRITPDPLFLRRPKRPRVSELKKSSAEKTIKSYEYIVNGIKQIK